MIEGLEKALEIAKSWIDERYSKDTIETAQEICAAIEFEIDRLKGNKL